MTNILSKLYPTKACIKCNEIKTLGCFYKNKKMADGHVNVCIKCKVAVHEQNKAQPSQNSLLLEKWALNTNRSNYAAQLPQYNRQYGR